MGGILRHKLFILGVLGLITIGFLYFFYVYLTNPSSIHFESTGAIELKELESPIFFFLIAFLILGLSWIGVAYSYKREKEEERISELFEKKYGGAVSKPDQTLLKDMDFLGWLTDKGNAVEKVVSTTDMGRQIYTFAFVRAQHHHGSNSETFYRVFLTRCNFKGQHRIVPRVYGNGSSIMTGLMNFSLGLEGLERIEGDGDFWGNFDVYSNNPSEANGVLTSSFKSLLVESHGRWPFVQASTLGFIEIADGKIAILCEPPRKVEQLDLGLELIKRVGRALER